MLCSGHLGNFPLTNVACSSKSVSKTRQLCVPSRHPYLSGLLSLFPRVDEELARLESFASCLGDTDGLQPGTSNGPVPRGSCY
jgi:hypothetical protein